MSCPERRRGHRRGWRDNRGATINRSARHPGMSIHRFGALIGLLLIAACPGPAEETGQVDGGRGASGGAGGGSVGVAGGSAGGGQAGVDAGQCANDLVQAETPLNAHWGPPANIPERPAAGVCPLGQIPPHDWYCMPGPLTGDGGTSMCIPGALEADGGTLRFDGGCVGECSCSEACTVGRCIKLRAYWGSDIPSYSLGLCL